MHVRQRVLGAVLVVLVLIPGFALAQGGGGNHWLLHDSRGRGPADRGSAMERGSAMQMDGMMQQMSGMMEHIAARIQAGPMTPEQTKQMSEVMRHIADMINNSYGMRGAETPQQILNMMERMTEMHKRLMAVMAGPK